jgi:hypothetical protein
MSLTSLFAPFYIPFQPVGESRRRRAIDDDMIKHQRDTQKLSFSYGLIDTGGFFKETAQGEINTSLTQQAGNDLPLKIRQSGD